MRLYQKRPKLFDKRLSFVARKGQLGFNPKSLSLEDFLIPRAYRLAKIAPEKPIAESRPQVLGRHFSRLDRPIRNAKVRLQNPRLTQRLSRANVQTALAGPTEIGKGGNGRFNLQARHNFRDQKETSFLRMDQTRIFPKPTQTGSLGEISFEQRARVCLGLEKVLGESDLKLLDHALQSFFDPVVVIAPLSVEGHAGLRKRRWALGVRLVRKCEDQGGLRFRNPALRIFFGGRVVFQITQGSVMSRLQPRLIVGPRFRSG